MVLLSISRIVFGKINKANFSSNSTLNIYLDHKYEISPIIIYQTKSMYNLLPIKLSIGCNQLMCRMREAYAVMAWISAKNKRFPQNVKNIWTRICTNERDILKGIKPRYHRLQYWLIPINRSRNCFHWKFLTVRVSTKNIVQSC